MCHEIDTATAVRTVWTFPSRGGSLWKDGGLKMENTQVCTAAAAAAKRERSLGGAERSGVRYRQQRDAGDTTSDGERWKVTGGAGRSGRVCGDGVQGWR